MNEPDIIQTGTNSSKEFSGRYCGIDASLFLYMIAPLGLGLFGFVALMGCDVNPLFSAAISIAPAAMVGVVIVFFVQGKPPGYLLDWFFSLFTKGNAVSPVESATKHHVQDY